MTNYDDGQHEFVGMDICIYCGECKQLLLQTKFGHNGKPVKGLSKYQSTGPEPCDKCKKKFEQEGCVPMIEAHPDEHTGQPVFGQRYIFMKREAIKGQEFIDFMNKHGFLICDHQTMDMFIQKMNGQSNNVQ